MLSDFLLPIASDKDVESINNALCSDAQFPPAISVVPRTIFSHRR